MTLLPIVERELRVAARRPATRWTRFFVVLAVIGVWLVLVAAAHRWTPPAALARHLFMACGILAFGFCLLAGVFLTADCLSSEKREGTLGLLFLTDLRGHDVVLGKLAATSLNASYALLGIVPVLALPVLMGGVTGAAVGRLLLVLLVTLFFSLALGLAVSATTGETRQAMGTVFLLLIVVAGVLPASWWIARILVLGNVVFVLDPLLLWPCPSFALARVLDGLSQASPGGRDVLISLAVIALMGLGLLLWSCLTLPRAWRQKGIESDETRSDRLGGPDLSAWPDSRPERRELLQANPFHWLVSRGRSASTSMRVTLFLGLAFWLLTYGGALDQKRGDEAFAICLFTAYGLHVALKCLLAVDATRRLSDDRQSGALELLLVTPLSVPQILTGHAQGMRRRFRGGRGALAAVNVAMMVLVLSFHTPHGFDSEDLMIFTGIFLGGILLLYLDSIVLNWVGMWAALRSRHHHRAVLVTLGRVMLAPWLTAFFFVFLMMMGNGSREMAEGLITAWFAVSLVTSALTGARARAELRAHFRRLAAGVPSPRTPNPVFNLEPAAPNSASA